jgi:rRNA-processing protein FCF1
MLRTTYVIDTSALMDYPKTIEAIGNEWNAHIYVHEAVIRELDYLKDNSEPSKNKKALAALKEINWLQKGQGEMSFPINKERGSFFFISKLKVAAVNVGSLADRTDNTIIGLAVALKERCGENDDVMVITKDTTIQVAAKASGMWGANYPLTPFDFLRISERCDEEEIEGAYKKATLKYHPDNLGHLELNNIEQNYAKSRLLDIQGAYERLRRNTGDSFKKETFSAEDLIRKYCNEDSSPGHKPLEDSDKILTQNFEEYLEKTFEKEAKKKGMSIDEYKIKFYLTDNDYMEDLAKRWGLSFYMFKKKFNYNMSADYTMVLNDMARRERMSLHELKRRIYYGDAHYSPLPPVPPDPKNEKAQMCMIAWVFIIFVILTIAIIFSGC